MAAAAWDVRQVSARPGYRERRGLVMARRRLVALVAALVLGTALGGVVSSVRAADPPVEGAAGPENFVTLVVAPGDTIWSLVAPHVPAGYELPSYVAEVLAYNDVRPADLQAGSVLRLPIP